MYDVAFSTLSNVHFLGYRYKIFIFQCDYQFVYTIWKLLVLAINLKKLFSFHLTIKEVKYMLIYDFQFYLFYFNSFHLVIWSVGNLEYHFNRYIYLRFNRRQLHFNLSYLRQVLSLNTVSAMFSKECALIFRWTVLWWLWALSATISKE